MYCMRCSWQLPTRVIMVLRGPQSLSGVGDPMRSAGTESVTGCGSRIEVSPSRSISPTRAPAAIPTIVAVGRAGMVTARRKSGFSHADDSTRPTLRVNPHLALRKWPRVAGSRSSILTYCVHEFKGALHCARLRFDRPISRSSVERRIPGGVLILSSARRTQQTIGTPIAADTRRLRMMTRSDHMRS